jgi:phenylacetate-CoA ligase
MNLIRLDILYQSQKEIWKIYEVKMNWESVYAKLPVPFQQITIAVEGWRLKSRRYNADYHRVYQEVCKRERLSEEELREYKENRLRKVLKAAQEGSPYYKRLFERYSFDVEAPHLIERLKELPILTKEEVKAHVEEILSCNIPRKQLIPRHTSGTTGSGMHFYETRETEQECWATWWRYRSWHGINQDTWCAYFGGRSIVPLRQQKPPHWRKNIPGRQLLFSAYHLSRQTAPAYVKALKESGATWVHGYPSLLALLAGFILEYNLDPGQAVRHVTIGAESLLPQQRQVIEQAFGAKVRQHYGQAESVANISECEYGNLHVDEDYSIVEFLPIPLAPFNKGRVIGDEQYRIIGTSLINPAFLFLRYDTGDIATLQVEHPALPAAMCGGLTPAQQRRQGEVGEGMCPCGRLGRLVKEIDGRKEDYVILPNGVAVGRLDHIFKDLVNIREAQIYQRQQGQIELRIVKGKSYTDKDEQELLKETCKRVGDDMEITVRYVDAIERTIAGKLRFVLSELKIADVPAMVLKSAS